jgi:hypothetical protein
MKICRFAGTVLGVGVLTATIGFAGVDLASTALAAPGSWTCQSTPGSTSCQTAPKTFSHPAVPVYRRHHRADSSRAA